MLNVTALRHVAEFRRCLVDLDVVGITKLWAHVAPGLAAPTSTHQTLMMLHFARTKAESIPLKLRAYSHRWLVDEGYESGLPDNLKPSAERLYPKIADAVGLSVNGKGDLMKAIVPLVRGSMEDAIQEAYADNRTEPTFVKQRMFEAKNYTIKKLLGTLKLA